MEPVLCDTHQCVLWFYWICSQVSQDLLQLVFQLRGMNFSQLKRLWHEASLKCRNGWSVFVLSLKTILFCLVFGMHCPKPLHRVLDAMKSVKWVCACRVIVVPIYFTLFNIKCIWDFMPFLWDVKLFFHHQMTQRFVNATIHFFTSDMIQKWGLVS